VVESPEEWAFAYLNDEVSTWITAGISQVDADWLLKTLLIAVILGAWRR